MRDMYWVMTGTAGVNSPISWSSGPEVMAVGVVEETVVDGVAAEMLAFPEAGTAWLRAPVYDSAKYTEAPAMTTIAMSAATVVTLEIPRPGRTSETTSGAT